MSGTEETKAVRRKGSEKDGGSVADLAGIAGAKGHDGGVDQVREILFGAQREEYDRRFTRMEELLARNVSRLDSDMAEKVGALRDEYDKRLARLEELLAKNIADLSNDTAKKLSVLKDDYTKKLAHVEELLDKLSKDVEQLRREKADKTAITKLLEKLLELSHHQTAGW